MDRTPGATTGRPADALPPMTGSAPVRSLAGLLPRTVAFWLLGAVQCLLLFASSAPSPLYVVYQARWHFSTSTLTAVFAIYVLALLATLLVAGSLSDHVGRRPVLVGALLIECAAMTLFAGAGGVVWLFIARFVQGVATGLATGAISAALLDLQPARPPRLGTLVNSTAPSVGLAVGALGTGLLVQYAPDPTGLVYLLLLALFIAAVVGVVVMPEPVGERGRVLAALRPHVGVPREIRREFARVTPCLIAVWALGGLYLSLGPSVAGALLHLHSHLIGGLVIFTLTGAAALTAVLLRAWPASRAMAAGLLALILGVVVTLVALAGGVIPLFFAGTAISGFGFGASFLGAYGTLVPLATSSQRGALISALYIVGYLAFSVPAVVAGMAVGPIGLRGATNAYGVIVAALALAAFALRGRAQAVEPATPAHNAHVSLCPCPCTVPPHGHGRRMPA